MKACFTAFGGVAEAISLSAPPRLSCCDPPSFEARLQGAAAQKMAKRPAVQGKPTEESKHHVDHAIARAIDFEIGRQIECRFVFEARRTREGVQLVWLKQRG
jgi:hypothetical protein